MSSPYSQIYLQVVFAVKRRQSLIHKSWEEELFKYITGTVQNKDQKMLEINGVPDHIHFFIGMRPSCRLSDLVREVKKSSNEFIKEKKFCNGFYWQDGYGAFSYSHSHRTNVINYIKRQKEDHKKQTFKDEYLGLLKKFEIEYEEPYLFEFLEY